MSNEKIGAIIINSDRELVKQIQEALPDYIESAMVKYADAKEKLFTGVNGAGTGLVILDADTNSDQALSLCKYIAEDPDKRGFKKVAVILLTADEFSDSALEFLAYGNPSLYSGEIDDSDFYIAVTDALEEAELREEDIDEADDSSTKQTTISPEKLMGMAYEMGKPELMRVVSYNNSDVAKALSNLVSKNKERAAEIYEILKEAAEELKEDGQTPDINIFKKEKVVKKVEVASKPVAAEKPNQTAGAANSIPSGKWDIYQYSDAKKVGALLSDTETSPSLPEKKPAGNVNRGFNNVNKQVAPQNVYRVNNNTTNNTSDKKKILIVDHDKTTLKAFNLFISEGYEFEQVETSMQAIDYIVKNTVDIVVVAYYLQGVSGKVVLNSILNQPSGRRIKGFLMMDSKSDDRKIEEALKIPGVFGIIKTPIVKKQLVAALNRIYTVSN